MKPPLAEAMIGPPHLTLLPGQRPLGDVLIPAGAGKAFMPHEGTFNRADMIDDPGVWSDRDRSHPPDPAALDTFARVLRNPAKRGMGAGPIHTITDFEQGQTLREQVEAVRHLRTRLAKSAEVSIGGWPDLWPRDDPAWADAESVVTCPTWGFYPHNGVIRGGLPYWLAEIDKGERRLKEWMPRRRRKMAILCPAFQVWWQGETEYADIVHLHDTPVPLEWWRAVLLRLRDGGWQPCIWGFQERETVRPHMDVVCELWGLLREVPSVVVVG